MRDGIGKPVFPTAPRARGCDLDPVCELPYRPAATERPQQRPNRCQHLTTRTTVPKILLALTEASTDGKTRQRCLSTRCVFRVRGPRRRQTDWRVRVERGDQVLIAAISGPTPKIVIIRFRL